jgi:hypothetical protein
MGQNLINILTASAAIGSFLVTAIGLFAVYVQIKKLRESIWGNTHSKLCDQSFELIKFLAEKPQTYDYFYNGKTLEEGSKDQVYVLYAAEALANFLEHLVLQRSNLPDRQWEVWRRFICSTYTGSKILQEFLDTHREWYSSELLSLTGSIQERLDKVEQASVTQGLNLLVASEDDEERTYKRDSEV